MSFTGLSLRSTVGLNRKTWQLGERLGMGACSEVYEATCESISGPGHFVAKVSPIPLETANKKRKRSAGEMNAMILHGEYGLYQGPLRGHPNVPSMPDSGYGDSKGLRFLILERLGEDLGSLAKRSSGLPVARVRDLGVQMLSTLRILHERHNMIFVDVKPENFMTGAPGGSKEGKVHLIDFGLAKRYIGLKGVHIAQSQGRGVCCGTPNFVSLACHGGAGPGRRDDIEALGYCILFLLGGDGALPWSTASSDQEGLKVKAGTPLDELCRLWPPLGNFISLARCTEFQEVPDYDAFTGFINDLIEVEGKGGENLGVASTVGPAPAMVVSVATTAELEETCNSSPYPADKTKGKGRRAVRKRVARGAGSSTVGGSGSEITPCNPDEDTVSGEGRYSLRSRVQKRRKIG